MQSHSNPAPTTLVASLASARVSKEFPEGYGDFCFNSKDGVVFYFPRLFLTHVSPVFKDMFQVGSDVQKQDTVTLAEDSATLESLLCHIDPAKDTPHLDWNRIANVLAAADKYQITSIIKWFEREVSLSLTAIHYPTLPNPMLYFALARRYNLRTTARLALRQLIMCPISEILGSSHVDSSLLKQVFELRISRAQWLAGIILEECPDNPYTTKRYGGCSIHSNYHHWKKAAIQAVIAEPSWSVIFKSVPCTPGSCSCVVLEHAKDQKQRIEIREAELPKLDW